MEHKTSRGSSRNYGNAHQIRRAALAQMPRPWFCARCGKVIHEGQEWDAGHVQDLALGGGLEVHHEHRSCNRAAGARLKERLRVGGVNSPQPAPVSALSASPRYLP